MKRSSFLLPVFTLSLAFAGCAIAPGPQRNPNLVKVYSHTPKPMTSPEAAIGTLRNMQTSFVPFIRAEGEKFTRLEVDAYGLRATAEWTETSTQEHKTKQRGGHFVGTTWVPYFGSSTDYTTSQQQNEKTLVIPFDEVKSFLIANFPEMDWEYKWCVKIFLEGDREVLVRLPDEYSARKFADAVATLAMARGRTFQEAGTDAEKEYGGIGVTMPLTEGKFSITIVRDAGPAQKAGILAGDQVLKIDDLSTKGMTEAEITSLIRGKPGTRVTLTIMRQGFEAPREITITRALIQAK